MSTVARQPAPITRQGYERLRAELDHLVTIRRRELADDLRDVRDDGSELAENGGLATVLRDQAALERRIDELSSALAFVRIVEPPADGAIGIGHVVRIRMGEDAATEYELVGPLEVDPAKRRISIDSPVGQALVGRRAGDAVEVLTPRGVRVVDILAVGEAA